jgi:hypothetical protein
MRKIYATVTVDLIIWADEDASTSETITEAVESMCITTKTARVEDASITNINVTDSK